MDEQGEKARSLNVCGMRGGWSGYIVCLLSSVPDLCSRERLPSMYPLLLMMPPLGSPSQGQSKRKRKVRLVASCADTISLSGGTRP